MLFLNNFFSKFSFQLLLMALNGLVLNFSSCLHNGRHTSRTSLWSFFHTKNLSENNPCEFQTLVFPNEAISSSSTNVSECLPEALPVAHVQLSCVFSQYHFRRQ